MRLDSRVVIAVALAVYRHLESALSQKLLTINGAASNLNTSIQRLLIDAIVVAENEIIGAKINNVDPVKGGTLPSFFIYNQRVE